MVSILFKQYLSFSLFFCISEYFTAFLTGAGCPCTAAQSAFSQFKRKTSSYMVHCLCHLIKRNNLMNTGKRLFRTNQSIGCTNGISVLTGASTRPAMGSQTKPSRLERAPVAAHKHIFGLPPIISTAAAAAIAEAAPTSA